MFTPIKTRSFRKLSLSQADTKINAARAGEYNAEDTSSTVPKPKQVNWNSCLSKPLTDHLENASNKEDENGLCKGKIRIKSVDELQASCHQANVDSHSTKPHPEYIISSGEEFSSTQRNSSNRNQLKLRKSRKDLSDDCVIISSDDETYFKPTIARRVNRKRRANHKTVTDAKIVVSRKLTKSTNLKTFSRKYMPSSQRSIGDYFIRDDSIKMTPCKLSSGHSMSTNEHKSIIKINESASNCVAFNERQSSPSSSHIIKPFAKIRKRIQFDSSEESEKLPSVVCPPMPSSESISSKIKYYDVNGTGKNGKRRSVKCPSYKVVEKTTFAVDAFRFGEIEGITHYFLTHFHADHYIGLKKSFSKPIFLSTITAKLVSTFIHTNSEFLHIIDVGDAIMVNGIEVIALDANHCPGALMFLFKFSSGFCTLHTGDFRASPDMEEGPIFWNNSINTIYLDTTYLSNKYTFKSQGDSIFDVISTIDDFREKHIGEKVLYVFGSYVIGKEKIWSAIAERYQLNVWTEGPRKKALDAIGNNDYLKYFVDDPHNAEMHILPIANLSYNYLVQYSERYSNEFNMLFAIRASGWERNSKPQYRGKINIIGIEYSEHSSFDELRRFVYYLQPSKIISTVPSGSDCSKTSIIPHSWIDHKVRSMQKGYQTSITNFIHCNSSKKIPSTSRIINEIDDAKCVDSADEYEMLDATLTNKTETMICESVSDWML